MKKRLRKKLLRRCFPQCRGTGGIFRMWRLQGGAGRAVHQMEQCSICGMNWAGTIVPDEYIEELREKGPILTTTYDFDEAGRGTFTFSVEDTEL
jgi:hypothetical protein